jgi:uncharacterized protein (DUF488 family)
MKETDNIITTFLNGRKWDVFNIKTGKESLREFLIKNNVDNVIDVRFTQTLPFHFNRSALSNLMKTINVAYNSMQRLGNPSVLRKLSISLSGRSENRSEFEKIAIKKQVLADSLPLDLFEGKPSNEISRALYFHYLAYFARSIVEEFKQLIVKYEKNCLICNCPTEDPKLCHRFWLLEYFHAKCENLQINEMARKHGY